MMKSGIGFSSEAIASELDKLAGFHSTCLVEGFVNILQFDCKKILFILTVIVNFLNFNFLPGGDSGEDNKGVSRSIL